MSYRIEYTTDRAIKRPAKWSALMKFSLASGIVAGSVLGLLAFFPEQIQALRQMMLPGKEAVTSLITDLESGMDFTQAVTVFCQELLHAEG